MQLTRTRVVAGVLTLMASWLVVGLWAVPLLIGQAYREESIAVLNRMLAGRGAVPLESYLGAWRSLFVAATLVLCVGGAAALASYRFPVQRKRLISRIVGGGADLGAQTVLWYAVWLGTIGGVGEVLYRGIRQAVTMRPAAGFYFELYWMGPLSAALAGAIVGLAMVGLARLGGTRWHVAKATVVLGFFAVYGVIQSEGIPLHPAAGVILALGLAATMARVVAPHAARLTTGLSRSRPYFVGLSAILLALAWYNLPATAERRALRGRAEPQEGLPNVLLVVLDAVRASSLGLYGYERATTPRLTEWAESGVVFDFALATAPWTLPTHAAAFTGRYNYELRTGFRRPLDETFPTLAEVLAGEGYATAGFAGNLLYTSDTSGLQRGFDRWEDYALGMGLFLESSWLSTVVTRRLVSAAGWSGSGWKDASRLTDEFLDWQTRQEQRPFFAFINFFDAHDPYVSPRAGAAFQPLPEEEWAVFVARWRSDPTVAYAPEHARLWVNMYDNAIAYIDHHLGIIRDALDARGVLDNTIVVVAADHGEMWGEHGLIGHAQALYLPVLRVPLAIWLPRGVAGGRRIDTPVSLRDLPATILDVIGLDGAELPGHSLASLWTGGEASDLSPLLAELDWDPTNTNPWDPVTRGDMKSLIDGSYHYVLNGDGAEELYDLTADPLEGNDLGRDPAMAPAIERLRASLAAVLTPAAGPRAGTRQ